jgi:hypothetical protein
MEGLKAAPVAGLLHLTGGWDGEAHSAAILAWDAVSETWQPAGSLVAPRKDHAATEVPLAALGDYCQLAE